ncbi:MAG: thioredoxin family protein [Bacteroidia bacterium]|nr:thioredoxin family protein [Bacteroidia bacterium]
MKKIYFTMMFTLVLASSAFAQNIANFSLRNVDGSSVSLNSYKGKAAVVVIFTSNHCVYSKKYESRIIDLAKAQQANNVQFILINSNDGVLAEEDNFASMQARATEKAYPFPYLKDDDQTVAKAFGAEKTPETFVLVPSGDAFKVVYKGLIDDNALMSDRVQKKYLEQALSETLSGGAPQTANTDAVGCSIKWK